MIIKQAKIFNNAKRFADNGVYLNEDRYDKPKEYFKLISSDLNKTIKASRQTFLDVGCATGEFIYYMKNQFKGLKFTGIDVSEKMIERAKKNVPSADFIVGSVFDGNFFKKNCFDIITCSGTIQLFDDLAAPINNLIKAANHGGIIYIFTLVNTADVDLITRYRLPKSANRAWQTGWNIFSKYTYETIIKNNKRVRSIAWRNFKMAGKLNKQSNPMRSYHNEQGLLVNGAGLILDQKLIKIKIK